LALWVPDLFEGLLNYSYPKQKILRVGEFCKLLFDLSFGEHSRAKKNISGLRRNSLTRRPLNLFPS
jgi:hypothetical protein